MCQFQFDRARERYCILWTLKHIGVKSDQILEGRFGEEGSSYTLRL
jgi:hypothetical protein